MEKKARKGIFLSRKTKKKQKLRNKTTKTLKIQNHHVHPVLLQFLNTYVTQDSVTTK